MEPEKKRNCGPQPTFNVSGYVFTLCQMQVISLLVSGLYRKEMADVLNVSESTVNTHLNRVYGQTRPMRRALLSSWAVLNGFDHHGNWNGIYLFDGKSGVPWEKEMSNQE